MNLLERLREVRALIQTDDPTPEFPWRLGSLERNESPRILGADGFYITQIYGLSGAEWAIRLYANLIVAAVNLLHDHGDEIERALTDAERYRCWRDLAVRDKTGPLSTAEMDCYLRIIDACSEVVIDNELDAARTLTREQLEAALAARAMG